MDVTEAQFSGAIRESLRSVADQRKHALCLERRLHKCGAAVMEPADENEAVTPKRRPTAEKQTPPAPAGTQRPDNPLRGHAWRIQGLTVGSSDL